jgi:hypothetical protein
MRALAISGEHSLGCLQFAELAGEPLALRIDARLLRSLKHEPGMTSLAQLEEVPIAVRT